MANRDAPLIEQLWGVWKELRKAWSPYLKAAGLDLYSADERTLVQRLGQPIQVNFGLPGLEEFARDGCRGIEPGDPARSLFYHVLASPHVVPESISDREYPTIRHLEVVENCIFAAARVSLADLQRRAGGAPLAIVVYCYEYAPAIDTVHNHHADLCFSRTGISRVGNAEPYYVWKSRGFLPNSGNRKKVHVVPARFGAFIAARKNGDKATFGPERFQPGDDKLGFWVPIHKLFNGPECIQGFDIELKLEAHHVNEKIRRVHLALQSEGVDTGWNAGDLLEYPFRIIDDELAKFDPKTGLLVPAPHDLVEAARTKKGKYVGFPVPKDHIRYNASLWFSGQTDARRSPEFVHVRHQLLDGKTIVYLPDTREDKSIIEIVQRGGYTALNLIDYTGDGWIDAWCPALAVHIGIHLSAYSVIGQPDFFPLVKQQDLIEWSENSAPPEIKDNIWPDGNRPTPLSEARIPANLTLTDGHFNSSDKTITVVVGMDRRPGPEGHILTRLVRRESVLSWRATNLFAPGFDTSQDFNRDNQTPNGTFHLANYGLGSPFPEDAMICASTGAFWPGAVPDMTRFFPPDAYPSVTPFSDETAGWDSVPLPERQKDGTYRYRSLEYSDYVRLILEGSFDYEDFAGTTLDDYVSRTLTLARVYQALHLITTLDRAKYAIVRYRRATEDELSVLKKEAGLSLDSARAHRIEIARVRCVAKPVPPDFAETRVMLEPAQLFFADPCTTAQWDASDHEWDVQRF